MKSLTLVLHLVSLSFSRHLIKGSAGCHNDADMIIRIKWV